VIEDRTQALLDVDPWRGDDALLDLAAWTGSVDGAGVVTERALAATSAPVDVAELARRAAARVTAVESDAPVTDELPFDLAPRPISRTGAREALTAFDAPAARAAMAAASARYLDDLHRWCPFTHWPPGTVAHGFPIVVQDAAVRAAITRELPGLVRTALAPLDERGAERAAALLFLPCHAGVTAAHAEAIVAGLARAGVDRAGP
jgi:hypothetical protein